MLTKFKKSVGIFLAAVFLYAVLPVAAEASDLEVGFEKQPLFSASSLVPGSSISRWVDITNNSASQKEIVTFTSNEMPCAGSPCLESAVKIKMTPENDADIFDDTLENFYGLTSLSIGNISASETQRFIYTLYLPLEAEDIHQGKTAGFDLVVGFKDGTVISDNFGGDGGNGSGAGGGGGGFFSEGLIIRNDGVKEADPHTETAIITWQTNLPGTSQVIYGLTSEGPYVLNLNAPNFGYPFSSVKEETKKTEHSVILTGLIPGEQYSFRVASHASPVTISKDRDFVMPVIGENINNSDGEPIIAILSLPNAENTVSEKALENTTSVEDTVVSEGSLIVAGPMDDDGEENGERSNMVAGLFALPDSLAKYISCSVIALLIFVAIFTLMALVKRRNRDIVLASEIIFILAGSVLASLILSFWFTNYACAFWPLWIITALYIAYSIIFNRRE